MHKTGHAFQCQQQQPKLPTLPPLTSAHSTLAVHPYMAAVEVNTAVTRSRSRSKMSGVKARMVPDSDTSSAMMLDAPGPGEVVGQQYRSCSGTGGAKYPNVEWKHALQGPQAPSSHVPHPC